MKYLLLPILLLFIAAPASAQDCPSPTKYHEKIQTADSLAAAGNFSLAYDNYSAAQIYCRDSAKAIDRARTALFIKINDLRELAEEAKTSAEKERVVAEFAKQEAEEAKRKTQIALDKTQQLIDAFYFYNDRYALAYKSGKFYFIDQSGVPIEQLGRWDDAGQFNRITGFATVTNDEINYLLDTLGNRYKLSFQPIKHPSYQAIILNGYPGGIFKKPYKKVFKNQELKLLTINDCKLRRIPNNLQLDKLEQLNLNVNRIKKLPSKLGSLSNLKELSIIYNQIQYLPPELGKLKNLEVLLAGGNQLKSIPTEVGNLSRLKSLNLTDNEIMTLPTTIGNLSSLNYLGLSYNKINQLPPGIGQLTELKHLSLNSNKLQTLPSEIGNLVEVTSINANNNNIKSLPPEIGRLNKLKNLALQGNELTTLPETIGRLNKLEVLNLSQNQLNKLNDIFGNLKQLKELDISENQLAKLPPTLYQLNSLSYLNLNKNKLCTLSREIGNLKALRELHIKDNELSEIPDNIGLLFELKHLDLSNNQFLTLPSEIGQLEKLKVLNLSNNRLNRLPDSIMNLKNLKILSLTGNMIAPEEIKKFTSLLSQTEIEIDYSGTALFFSQLRQYGKAYKVQKWAVELDSINHSKWYALSSFALINNRAEEAIYAANKTIQLKPSIKSIELNLAFAYLLNNQFQKAEPLFLKWKGKYFPNDPWSCDWQFLNKIEYLEDVGITHPDFAKVKALLKK